jgi:EAL domain-containing protein (putative c-di-GMP-specific phosphodiesterase class I)
MGEAVGLMTSASFDVVVSDVMMPGDDGISMLRAAHVIDADLPVILMTGAPTVESAMQAVDSGAVKYLMKPVMDGRLEAAVQEALAQFRLAQRRRVALADSDAAVKVSDGLEELSRGFGRALDQLWMAYQPIVSWSGQAPFAYEALMRTDEPSLPNPGVFLAAAEQLGQLDSLGQAIRNSVAARIPSIDASAVTFVNLHPQDLNDETLYSPDSPLSKVAKQVVLEITERASLDEVDNLAEKIAALRALGFRIAIDDLGSGYSGLSSLVELRPDVVKLDMSLVRGISADSSKQQLIATLTAYCRSQGILVVAEGIETIAERDVLVAAGVDLLQGYLFARPQREPPKVAAASLAS